MLIVGFARQQQVFVVLDRVGFLGVGAHDDLAVEDADRAAVENALVELMAGAVRLGVVDQGVVIDVLRAVDGVQTVEVAMAAFVVEHHVDVVAGQRAAERERMGRDGRVAPGEQLDQAGMERLQLFVLDLVELDVGVLARQRFQ